MLKLQLKNILGIDLLNYLLISRLVIKSPSEVGGDNRSKPENIQVPVL